MYIPNAGPKSHKLVCPAGFSSVSHESNSVNIRYTYIHSYIPKSLKVIYI